MARSRTGKGLLLAGVLAGMVIGAGVGLVYAPYSGDRTRKLVADWFTLRTEQVRAKIGLATGTQATQATQATGVTPGEGERC